MFSVGFPFDALRVTAATGACSIANGGCTLDEASLASADGADVFGHVIYRYNSSQPNASGGLGDYNQLVSGDVMLPWEGYWVFELPAATGNSPMLHMPDDRF